jgi:hypothetical protein
MNVQRLVTKIHRVLSSGPRWLWDRRAANPAVVIVLFPGHLNPHTGYQMGKDQVQIQHLDYTDDVLLIEILLRQHSIEMQDWQHIGDS